MNGSENFTIFKIQRRGEGGPREGRGRERKGGGKGIDFLHNSILLVKPKEEKRSNKTRPIFGKEVTGKEIDKMRPLWERMGGPQKSKFPGNPWGKCHTPSSHLLSLQHPSTQSAFTRDETPHPYPLGCLRAKALPHFTHFHTHFGNSTLPIQNQACHPSLQSIVSPSKYKGEGENAVWHLHFLKHPIGQKSKKAMS